MLEMIDLFGKEIIFKVDKADKYRTKVGGAFSLTLGILSIISFYLFGNDIFYKFNPKFLIRKTYLENYPYHILNKTNMFLAIQLADYYGVPIDDSVLTSKFYYTLLDYDNQTEHLTLTENVEGYLQKCNETHVRKEVLEAEGLENYMCFSFNNYTVGGSWHSKRIGFAGIRNYVCSEVTEKELGIKCKSREEIAKKSEESFYINVRFWNGVVNPSDFNKPVKKIIEFQSFILGIDDYKQNSIHYTQAKVDTDIGLITEEMQSEQFLLLEKSVVDVSNSIAGKICETVIYITKMNQEFSRSYLKLQELFATVGGLFSVMYHFLGFIYFLYVGNNMNFYFFDKIFKLQIGIFEANEKDGQQNEQPLDTEIDGIRKISVYNRENEVNRELDQLSNVIFHRKSSRDEQRSNNTFKSIEKSRLNTILQHKNKPRKNISLEESQLWCFKFCRCSKDSAYRSAKEVNQVIFLAQTELDKRMDIINYFKLCQQFQIFKKIFLNESQCFMMENLDKKPITNIPVSKELDYTLTLEIKFQERYEKLKNYLSGDLKSQDNVDMFLFSHLDEKIRDSLELKKR